MNYLKVYCNLIRKAENRTLVEGYTERHHTFPISIFGKNKRVVVLTAREHYIAHALLERVCIKRYGLNHYRTHKMTYAFWGMNRKNGGQQRYFNSYFYESSKIKFHHLVSDRCGEKNSFYGKSHNEETKKIISQKNRGNNNFLGKTHTEISKEKIREKSIGRKVSEDTRKKLSQKSKGRKHTEETIQKMRSKKLSKKQKEVLREVNKGNKYWLGKNHTQETKEKMRNSALGRVVSEETKRKISEKVKNPNIETLIRMSEAQCKNTYKCINPNGNVFITKNLTKFCLENNIDRSAMRRVMDGKQRAHKGWTGVLINKEKDSQ